MQFGVYYQMRIFYKLLKIIYSNFPINKIRLTALKISGVEIGSMVYLGESILIIKDQKIPNSKLIIGNRVSIAPRVSILLASGPNNSVLQKHFPLYGYSVILEDDCWIGTGAIIYPGITVGNCSVVLSGSVVTKNVPSFSVVGGVPAKIIKRIII